MSETTQFKCARCGHEFVRTFGVDVNGKATLYCNRCGKAQNADFSLGWMPVSDCDCGGSFTTDALGCCPNCGSALSENDVQY